MLVFYYLKSLSLLQRQRTLLCYISRLIAGNPGHLNDTTRSSTSRDSQLANLVHRERHRYVPPSGTQRHTITEPRGSISTTCYCDLVRTRQEAQAAPSAAKVPR